jgi:hypothetical protein
LPSIFSGNGQPSAYPDCLLLSKPYSMRFFPSWGCPRADLANTLPMLRTFFCLRNSSDWTNMAYRSNWERN